MAYYQPQAQMQMPQTANMIFSATLVQGEAGAQMYPVAAGNTVFLADFNSKLMWIKSTASNGLPQPIRKFKLEEISEAPPFSALPANMVTREEFTSLENKINKLLEALGEGKNNG